MLIKIKNLRKLFFIKFAMLTLFIVSKITLLKKKIITLNLKNVYFNISYSKNYVN